MHLSACFNLLAVKTTLILCMLILALSGCANLGELTGARMAPTLTPAPMMPGTVITDEYICIPHEEAANLLLWIEHAEQVCR